MFIVIECSNSTCNFLPTFAYLPLNEFTFNNKYKTTSKKRTKKKPKRAFLEIWLYRQKLGNI